jgi:hypothetical protein
MDRLAQSLVDRTADLAGLELVLYVDDDDERSRQWTDERLRVVKIVGPSASMGTYNSACLKASSGRVIVLLNDDVVVRSPRWDVRVLELDRQFPDGIYLGYGDDLLKRHRVSTFPILSRSTCDLLGEPFDSSYRGALIDYHLFDVFKRLERLGHDRIAFLEDVVFDHVHYRTGRAAFDETYRRRDRFGDDEAFLGLRTLRQELAERLEARIGGRSIPPPTGSARLPAVPASMSFLSYWHAFMEDAALPWRWRAFLFLWFSGRHVAARRPMRFRNTSRREANIREQRGA